MQHNNPIMQLRGVVKAFPNGTLALRGVDLDIEQGKVHGLLGANGAGKSTLIKILSGTYWATLGEIIWRGKPVIWDNPKAANEMGVATVHQHIPLVPTLSVIENTFLGRSGLWRRSSEIRLQFDALCKRIGYWVDPDALVGSLSIGERQMVSIMKAVGTGADLIVMDEPTASLAAQERELVYDTVNRLSKGENKAILFVSHFLDEVMALTDQVTVLRDGKAVLRANTSNLDENRIAEAIVGKQIVALERQAAQRSRMSAAMNATPRLQLRDLASKGKLAPTSLTVAPGEVVGVAGLLGSGRSELLHAIYGSDKHATGAVILDGKPIARNAGAAVKAGIGMVPEDRMAQGLVPDFEIWRNTTLPALSGVSAMNALPIAERERERGWEAIRLLSIKASSPDIRVKELSGGNAQKVTIAKWLFSDVKLFLLDEPTAGIDIGAKTDILRLIRQLASEGKSIIVVSSEFEELLAVSDRILIMRDGKCVAERGVRDTSEHDLLLLAGGQSAGAEAATH
jgi:ribose transport system ATP-binding protein